jgi:hypothetical protein
MGASQQLMGGSVTSRFQHQKKQSIKLHIFLVITSAMESTYKQLVMQGAGLFFCPYDVREGLVTVGHFMAQSWTYF